jgi:hypothetical protein
VQALLSHPLRFEAHHTDSLLDSLDGARRRLEISFAPDDAKPSDHFAQETSSLRSYAFICEPVSTARCNVDRRVAVSANDISHQLFVRFHYVGYAGHVGCFPSKGHQIVAIDVLKGELARTCHELL